MPKPMLTLPAVLAGLCLSVAPAAGAPRSFVSGLGNDAADCSRASPCRSFAQAVKVTDAGGEVTALDSAGYGPVTIDKSITLTSPSGVEASIEAERDADAVTITGAAATHVTLRGLTIQGLGVARNGIVLTSTFPLSGPNGSLDILDCVIRNFADDGVHVQPRGTGSSGQAPTFRLTVSRTAVLDNGASGISVTAHAMLVSVYSMSDLTVMRNRTGILLSGDASSRTPSALNGTLSRSHVEMNVQAGLVLNGHEVFALMTGNLVKYNGALDLEDRDGSFALVNRNSIGTLVSKTFSFTDGTNTYAMGPSSTPPEPSRNYMAH